MSKTTVSSTTKNLVIAALMIALSFVGANIKVMGSVAFDALPAFLAALVLGPMWGAVVAVVGHMLTALTSGFPLTLPVHLLTSAAMALVMVVFYFSKKIAVKKLSLNVALIIAAVVGTIMNGPVALAITTPLLLPMMGMGGVLGLLPVLTLASAANVVLASLLYRILPEVITGEKKPA